MTYSKMSEDIFEFILAHALADVQGAEIRQAAAEFGDVRPSDRLKVFFQKLIAKRKRRQFLRSMPRYLKRTLISFSAVLSALSIALFSQGPVQAAVKSVFYEWTQAFVLYEAIDGASSDAYYGIRLNYVPAGYVHDESVIRPITFSTVAYRDPWANGEVPMFIRLTVSNNSFSGGVDNEHGVIASIDLDDASDVLYIKSTDPEWPSYLMWTKQGYFYLLSCPYDFSTAVIQKIANNIEIVF